MDEEEPPLRRGHRHAREAEEAESNKRWTTAMYKHEEARKCFTECLGLTGHPEANRAILLLISKHTKKYEGIREKLANNKSIKNILTQNGYIKNNKICISNNSSSININNSTYTNLRKQMQEIVSYSHQKLISNKKNKNIILNHIEEDDKNNKQTQMNNYLKNCDVRQSVSIGMNPKIKHMSNKKHKTQQKQNNQNDVNDNDSSKIINKTKININDNFFNPNHAIESNEKLLSQNKMLCERVKMLENELKSQTKLIDGYQNEIQNKVKSLRQSFDHLYNLSNHGNNNNNNDESKNNDEHDQNIKIDEKTMNSAQMKEIISSKLEEEKERWQKDKERLKIIHSRQLQELKKKIKDWMEYAKKQEHHSKVYKKQLQLLQQQNNKHTKPNINSNHNGNNHSNNNFMSPSINHRPQKKQIYSRGTLSRAKQNAIPESQEISISTVPNKQNKK